MRNHRGSSVTIALVGGLLILSTLGLAGTALAGGDWNDQGVAWKSYDDALAEAKKSKKPICLIFYTQWCPHCQNYSGVFHDPKVVEKSKEFVMVRIDADKDQKLSDQFALDGKYIPRTYFLAPDGKVDAEITVTGRDKFKYFYDEKNPASVLAGMDTALKKLQ